MRLSLPANLTRKISKTGQTRGADDDQIYQNRVARNSTVLIPYSIWERAYLHPEGEDAFENGYIALVSPAQYFNGSAGDDELRANGLALGENALLFYETRAQWNAFPPESAGLQPGTSRQTPLGGEYIARVPATTAQQEGEKVNRGYNTTKLKGAGIRLYEYATSSCIIQSRKQLEALYWMCADSVEAAVQFGMKASDARKRRDQTYKDAKKDGLLDLDRMKSARAIDANGVTVCPLCLMQISGVGFYSRIAQAEGREVADLTVTEINLFHIEELRYSAFNHRPYNLGWGHHHCNVVTKDAGIGPTVAWMKEVVDRNERLVKS